MNYKFLDYGDERRLEQFGDRVVDRFFVEGEYEIKEKSERDWKKAEAFFVREDRQNIGWEKADDGLADAWQMDLDFGLKCELRLASHNQVGIFPEQLDNWRWLNSKIKHLENSGDRSRHLNILNGFAYTGIATLYAAQAGENVSVCHLDGSRPAINWAKKNTEISGIPSNQVRWIEDDVLTFLRREVKRGNKYDGFILDPPAFGRGKKGDWKIGRDLYDLFDLVAELLSDDPVFVIVSCHALGISKYDLADELRRMPKLKNGKVETLELQIPVEGRDSVEMGVCVRWSRD